MQEFLHDEMKLQVDISDELKIRLKVYSARTNITMSEIAEKALKEYLDKLEGEEGK
jgi:predicted transcriptional regulator